MKMLITGGAGFIGSNLTELLLKNNHELTVIDNLITGSKKNIEGLAGDLTFVEGDVTTFDFDKLHQSFDIIFHLASPASPIQYTKHPVETLMVNSLGTKRLLDFMVASKSKRFVLASTSEVYGDPQKSPQAEDYWGNVNPNGIRSCYDESKRFAEAAVMTYFRKYNHDVRIARIFNTYGPHMEKEDGRVVSNFICQCLQGSPITVNGDGGQTRSFCFVSDMIEALLQLGMVDDIAGEVINVGNPDERTIIDIAKIIKKLTKSDSEITFAPMPADDPRQRKPNISKAQKLLKWEPEVALEDGLTQTIEYFRDRFFKKV